MFPKVFTSLILLVFGGLFVQPLFGLQNLEGKNLVILSQVSDFCSVNIECEKTESGYIRCEKRGETLSAERGSIHGIESEKTLGYREGKESIFLRDDKKHLSYNFSDTSVSSFTYPFVRIIKIQV